MEVVWAFPGLGQDGRGFGPNLGQPELGDTPHGSQVLGLSPYPGTVDGRFGCQKA